MDLARASDERLLTASGVGPAGDAYAELYQRYERPMHAYFVRRVKEPEIAADLAATVFTEALASRRRFRNRGEGSAAAWLYGIAHHVHGRHARTATAERRRDDRLSRELPPPNHPQLDEIASLQTDEALRAAIAELPDTQRSAVYAYVVAEDTYAEIAQFASIDQATVRKRVSRGLASLRSTYKGPRQ